MEIEGLTKVKSLLTIAGNVVDLMKPVIDMVEAFEMNGYDM